MTTTECPRSNEKARDEFCARFKAHMLKLSPFDKFDDGMTVAEYAEDTAPTYYDNPDQRAEGPEECAESDMSYWGD